MQLCASSQDKVSAGEWKLGWRMRAHPKAGREKGAKDGERHQKVISSTKCDVSPPKCEISPKCVVSAEDIATVNTQ